MNRKDAAVIVVPTLVGLSIVIWILLFIFASYIRPKRKIYICFMLLVTAVSSYFSFYLLVPLAVYIYFTATVYVYWACYVKPGLRPLWFRLLISWPASIYQAVCILMLPVLWVPWIYWKWTVLVAVGIVVLGFIQSWVLRKEYVYITLHPTPNNSLHRRKVMHKPPKDTDPPLKSIKVAQITDPHVGIHMSPERLNKICAKIVAWQPDFVFITGDILTVESYYEPDKLVYAFQPLSQLPPGKAFACLGNHDYESQTVVEDVLLRSNVTLLKDEDAVVQCPAGKFQIIGTEFSWEIGERRAQRIQQLAEKFQERKAPTRIFLTHNPAEFKLFPDGTVDIMFSGHTHGGQMGLQSLGINFTFMGMLSRSPDFGLWQYGKNLLYVHRGTGFQGFPVRLGVSNELSLVTVYLPPENDTTGPSSV